MPQAANALLKTLEEPPLPGTFLILAADQSRACCRRRSVSRCRRLPGAVSADSRIEALRLADAGEGVAGARGAGLGAGRPARRGSQR